jgi:hypothetical protein
MASCTQFGLHQMPVPADIASAVDQDECGHTYPPSAAEIPIETATAVWLVVRLGDGADILGCVPGLPGGDGMWPKLAGCSSSERRRS